MVLSVSGALESPGCGWPRTRRPEPGLPLGVGLLLSYLPPPGAALQAGDLLIPRGDGTIVSVPAPSVAGARNPHTMLVSPLSQCVIAHRGASRWQLWSLRSQGLWATLGPHMPGGQSHSTRETYKVQNRGSWGELVFTHRLAHALIGRFRGRARVLLA